ncbi:MAG: glutamine amidotransferase [Rhodospirillaceae bacterium]|nr:glutamine amidotransferase [Rhodospirillaceae bacterium]
MTTVLAIRHVAFEDLGTLGDIFATRKWTHRYVEAGTVDWSALDPLADDLVVVLGGPIGVYEADDYPFLSKEIEFLKKRLAAEKPTLGLCLGSQLIAAALGAAVYPAGVKEIGWMPLQIVGVGQASPLKHLSAEQTFMFHWHGDTFDLPDDALLLASTEACKNQAFIWHDTVLALQCHPEVRARDLENWFIGHAAELSATPGINARILRGDTQRYGPALERQARLCFGAWLDSLKLGSR